jgi:hypothetical protein
MVKATRAAAAASGYKDHSPCCFPYAAAAAAAGKL